MGRRGPIPLPTALLRARGSRHVTRRREQDEVQGPPGHPRCPRWLDPEAQATWRHLVPLLGQMGVLTRIDGLALARYCRVFSRWRKAEAFIDQHGEMYPLKDEAGRVKYFVQWPQVAIANKLCQHLTRLEQEFGMTPSARTRIQVSRSPSAGFDPKERFFQAI